jgi:hypothetical protein
MLGASFKSPARLSTRRGTKESHPQQSPGVSLLFHLLPSMAREKLDVMKNILAMGNVGYPALFGGVVRTYPHL